MKLAKSKLSLATLFTLLFCLILLFPAKIFAAETYIVKNNSTGVEYETISSAVEAVKNNEELEVIKLTEEPFTINENINSIGKNYNLNLNNNIIDGQKKGPVYIINGGTVTIKNGTLQNGFVEKSTIPTNYYYSTSGVIRGGAGLLISNSTSDVLLENVIITENTANYGAGIMIDQGKLTLRKSKISNNTGLAETSGEGAGIHVPNKDADITMEDSIISQNHANNAAAIWDRGSMKIINSKIQENTGVDNGSYSYATIYLNPYSVDPVEFINSEISDNSNTPTVVYTSLGNTNSEVVFRGTQIQSNTVYSSTVYHVGGTTQFADSVIKNNRVILSDKTTYANTSGGISMNSYKFNFESGAIYNNSNENSDGATDIYKRAVYGGSGTKSSFIDASEMFDSSELNSSLKDYKWRNETSDLFLTGTQVNSTSPSSALKLAAVYDPIREIAVLNNQTYSSLKEAIEVANQNKEGENYIQLVAGDDGIGDSSFRTNTINISSNITIDLNGKTLVKEEFYQSMFNVNKGGSLTLTGTGILPDLNSFAYHIIVNKDGQAKVDAEIITNKLYLQDSNSDPAITIGENFKYTGPIVLNSGNSSKINKGANVESMIPILKDQTGVIDPAQFSLEFVTNSDIHIFYAPEEQMIYVQTFVLPKANEYVVSSEDGDDDYPGSRLQPIKTINEAITRIEESGSTEGIIHLKGTYQVQNDETIGMKEPKSKVTIIRTVSESRQGTFYDLNGEDMIQVGQNATLTLQNIIIDGGTKDRTPNVVAIQRMDNGGQIIEVANKGNLIIEEGTVLTNNKITNTKVHDRLGNQQVVTLSHNSGGAIFSNGKVIMNGGLITNNEAFSGGAIYIRNSGSFYMNGGTISNNRAKETYNSMILSYGASGGAVLIMDGAVMEISDGILENNSASDGGAVSVGCGSASTTSSKMNSDQYDFIMKGGTITNNTVTDNGGGIFIQASYKGLITAGTISYNHASGGTFGGGGIYVNQNYSKTDKNIKDGKLVLENVLITDNVAASEGGGIAVCGRGSTTINANKGAIIEGNTSNNSLTTKVSSKDDLALTSYDGSGSPYQGYKDYKDGNEDNISQFMLENIPYNWRNVTRNTAEGTLVSEHQLSGKQAKHFYSDLPNSEELIDDYTTTNKLKTFIYGNSTNTNGGGIGANGDVIIGESDEDHEITINKNWNNVDQVDKETWLGNEFKQVNIWLFAFNESKDIVYKAYSPLYAKDYNGKTTASYKWFDSVSFKTLGDDFEYRFLEQIILNDDNSTCLWSVPSEDYKETLEFEISKIMESDYPNSIPYSFTNQNNSRVDSEFEGNTFANTVYNQLTVKKVVSGPAVDPNQEFEFIITLSDSISGTYGEITFEEGIAHIFLRDGESKTAVELPVGIEYSIEEVVTDAYTSSTDREPTGVIEFGSSQTILFTNTRSTGDLKVSKKVTGTNIDLESAFNFIITLSDSTVNEQYGDMIFTDGIAEVSLKGGESATAVGLPVNTTYTVTEEETDYKVFSENEEGKISKDETALVEFTNVKNDEDIFKTEIAINDELVSDDKFTTNKDGSLSAPIVAVGDTITYQINWTNFTEEKADITINDLLDEGVDFISASDNGQYDRSTHTVTWVIQDQEPGAQGNVTLTVQVNDKADYKWRYDEEDPLSPDASNEDKGENGNRQTDHRIVNQAVITIDNDSRVTNKVENQLEGLYIEKIHAIVSLEELGDNYREELFGDSNVYDLPEYGNDPSDGNGFTNLLNEDTPENEYKRTYTHDPGNTVRYYVKVTNNYKEDLEHVIIMDPVRINSNQSNSFQTSFNGIAGTVSNPPEIEGRTQQNVSVEPLYYDEEDGTVVFKLSSTWSEWTDSSIELENAIPDNADFVAASYRTENTEGPVEDNVIRIVPTEEELQKGEVIEFNGTDTDQDTSISYDPNTRKVTWKYSVAEQDPENENYCFLRLRFKDPVDKDDLESLSCGTQGCIIGNNIKIVDDSIGRTNSIKAIFNRDNISEDFIAGDINQDSIIDETEGYLRWELDRLPGTLTAEEVGDDEDGYPANTQIVYFCWDIPKVDEYTSWENTAYVQTMEKLQNNLSILYKDKYADYLDALSEISTEDESNIQAQEEILEESEEPDLEVSDPELNNEDSEEMDQFVETEPEEASEEITEDLPDLEIPEETEDVEVEDETEESSMIPLMLLGNEKVLALNPIAHLDNDPIERIATAVAENSEEDYLIKDNSSRDHISIFSTFSWDELKDAMMESNTVREVIDAGSLVISKEIDSNTDPETEFTFKVSLDFKNALSKEDMTTLPGQYEILDEAGNLTGHEVVNGTGTFTLKGGETVRIDNLPLRTKFTIQETNNKEYTVTAGIVYPEGSTESDVEFKGSTVSGVITNNKKEVQVLYLNEKIVEEFEVPETPNKPQKPSDDPTEPNSPDNPTEPDLPEDNKPSTDVTVDNPSTSESAPNTPENDVQVSQSTTTTTTGVSTVGASPNTGVTKSLSLVVLIAIAIGATYIDFINKKKRKNNI